MAKVASEIPNKLFYKIGEVCEITDTQPYVLRFWESEFPQLAPRKNRSGQRVYQRKDIDTVIRIKKLLYEEEYTIAGARKKLDDEPEAPAARAATEAQTPPARAPRAAAERPPSAHVPAAAGDHPVDALSGRAETGAARAAKSVSAGDPDREARLEKGMAELKRSLREILTMLRKE
ncbi:MAG TPA: MerR family transcriptional regulator [Candidatus Polarisedimenticolia bacterium]|nr:MerR family transcriptional regulator [Candidatus Polarisedimenticolia bacterium]